MYQIKVDGSLLYSSASEELAHIVLNPKVTLDVNSAGSLSFVLPPGNTMHGKLQKLKSIITVEQEGVEIFRGRVLDDQTDIYNQISVYCEGQKAFLLDSQIAPYDYSGTVHGLFQRLINNHNSMVDPDKKFAVGNITAVDANKIVEVTTKAWATASGEIEDRLLNVYGGYLRTRKEGNTSYIDWVEQYGDINSQAIEFSVNLLDLTEKIDAGGVFTVLIPLGESTINDAGEYGEPLSIASVNGGQNYIQDDEAVARYGKIWRTRTWSYESDPAELLKKAREHLKTGVSLETLTLKAVDMHFANGNVQPIRIGDRVHIISSPHGVDKIMMCSQIEIDLLNPENTLYTFGEQVRTLTENVVKAEEEIGQLTGYGGRGGGGGGRKSVQEEISDIIRWAKINVDETNAYIQLTAGELDKTNKRLSAAEIELDGANAQINIAASRMDDLEGRTTSAEIAIDGVNAAVALKANQTTVDKLSGRVSTTEAQLTVQAGQISTKVSQDGVISAINQTAESVTIKASKINLSGYVTTSQLNSSLANIFAGNIDFINAGTVSATTLKSTYLSASSFTFNGTLMSKRSMKVSTPDGEKTIYYLGYAG